MVLGGTNPGSGTVATTTAINANVAANGAAIATINGVNAAQDSAIAGLVTNTAANTTGLVNVNARIDANALVDLAQDGALSVLDGRVTTNATLFDTPTGTFTGEKDSHGRPKFIPTWNWRSTTGKNKIYIEIFDWPTGAFHLDNVAKLPRNVTSAYLLADPAHKPLKLTKTGEGPNIQIDIQLPAKPLDPIATVMVLNTTN